MINQNSNYMVLHSKLAQSLVKGDWKKGRVGLIDLARIISKLWRMKTDPRVELCLLKLDKLIFLSRQNLCFMETACRNKLNELRGMEISIYHNPSPVKFALNFSNPLSYMAAALIMDIDFLIRTRLMLQRCGVAVPEDVSSFSPNMMMRHIFNVAKQAELINGDQVELPNEMLNGGIEFSFSSPSARKKSFEFDFL